MILFSGLSQDRKWYLFEEIRPCVLTDAGKNEVCPYPNCPKTKHREFKQKSISQKVRKLLVPQMRQICLDYNIPIDGKNNSILLREAITAYAEHCEKKGIAIN